MKIVVVGAGKLGLAITEVLLGSGYDITLIDRDEATIQRVGSRYDILTVNANAKRVDVLSELEIWNYDLLIAATDKDERNMVICNFAKELGCPQVIARVRSPEHVEQLDFAMKAQKIDYIVNPDMACASEIYKYLTEKYTLKDGRFSAGDVSILEFNVNRMPALIDLQLKDLPRVLDNILIAAVSRNGKIIIPNGNTILQADDTLYVIGSNKRINEISNKVREQRVHSELSSVMIAGGGGTGYFLAKKLADFGVAVKLIEIDRDRCEWLSARLDGVLILHGDATDMNLLQDEDIADMDAFVAVTGFDEENLLLSLTAKQMNIKDVVAKVSRNSYASLMETLGVSMIINPVDMCASNILRHIQKDDIIIFSQIIQGQAEFIEVWAEEGMPLTEDTLLALDIPEGVLIAAIRRGKDMIIPKGSTQVEAGDRVIILSLLSAIPHLQSLIKH
ncbi:MAG: Trk system potassium transporter TrkA [Clostridiales bacterium]|nr:Trk system potassium transporter TrkA [Clostridiales bacterium]